jgi:hypothetical protein
MVALLLLPNLDAIFQDPIFHFYIVTFFTFTSAVVALLFASVLGERSLYRHRLLVTAFASMAAIFFVHGTTTNGALILQFNPGIRWAAWLTLFVGGLLFALAAFDRPITPLKPQVYRNINWSVAVFCFLFMGVVYLKPEWLTAIDNVVSPFHSQVAFLSLQCRQIFLPLPSFRAIGQKCPHDHRRDNAQEQRDGQKAKQADARLRAPHAAGHRRRFDAGKVEFAHGRTAKGDRSARKGRVAASMRTLGRR